MKLIDVCNKVVAEKTAALIRPKLGVNHEYDVKEMFGGKKKGWVLLDLFTASAISKVAAALNETNRAKLNTLPPLRVSSICFQLLK